MLPWSPCGDSKSISHFWEFVNTFLKSFLKNFSIGFELFQPFRQRYILYHNRSHLSILFFKFFDFLFSKYLEKINRLCYNKIVTQINIRNLGYFLTMGILYPFFDIHNFLKLAKMQIPLVMYGENSPRSD